jgi:LysM repeat protein
MLLMATVAIRFTPGSTVGASLASATTSKRAFPTFWVIHTGQTIALVSALTGLSVAAIERLNAHADPGELVSGQRIRLRATAPKS